jgi:hypothetical protein
MVPVNVFPSLSHFPMFLFAYRVNSLAQMGHRGNDQNDLLSMGT